MDEIRSSFSSSLVLPITDCRSIRAFVLLTIVVVVFVVVDCRAIEREKFAASLMIVVGSTLLCSRAAALD